MTDQEALEAAKRGDEVGFEYLVAKHQVRALRLAYQITRDRSAAEEVVADSFLAVYENLRDQDSSRPFEPWLIRIVTNRAITVTRRAARTRRMLQILGRIRPKSEDPVELAEQNEMNRSLALVLRSLPVKERAALALRYYLDLDERAIADSLGWPVGSVKTRLHRGRARMRVFLAGEIRDIDLAYGPGGTAQ